MSRSQRLLRRALGANALFSAVCGGLCLVVADRLAAWIGVSAGELQSLGAQLVIFAVGLAVLRGRDLDAPWPRRWVATVIALDVLWVVASAALLATDHPLTVAGQWTVVLVACCVGDFAFLQWRGWRGMAQQRATAGASAAQGLPMAAAGQTAGE